MGAEKLEALGADIIGTMCGGTTYEENTAALKEMRQACSRPLATRPNAGVPQLVDGKAVHPATPEDMAREAPEWVAAGARLVSGCCGTTPAHLAAVASVIKGSG